MVPGSPLRCGRDDKLQHFRLNTALGRTDMPAEKKPEAKAPAKAANPKKRIVQTLNVNTPGRTYPRDSAKYEAAREA